MTAPKNLKLKTIIPRMVTDMDAEKLFNAREDAEFIVEEEVFFGRC